MPRLHKRVLIGLVIGLISMLGGLWLLAREVGRSYEEGGRAIATVLVEGLRQMERVDTGNPAVPAGSRIQLDSIVVGEILASEG
jgi:hypothetical protein